MKTTPINRNFLSSNISIITTFYILICIIQLTLNEETSQVVSCSNLPFCQRFMFYAEDQNPLFFLDNNTISISGTNKDSNNILTASIKNYNKEFLKNSIDLELKVFILKHGIFRVKIKPTNDKNYPKRFELNEEDDVFNMKENFKNNNIKISKGDKNIVIYYFSKKRRIKYELVINLSPFQIKYKIDNNDIFFINNKHLFDIENPDKDFVKTENDAMTTIKMDMFLPESILISGLPERCGSSILSDTSQKGQDGYYHFYNIDIFKYNYDQYNAIYGSLPYLMSYSYGGNYISGFFWNNPSETFIYLKTNNDGKQTIFVSEGGIFDFSFLGDLNIENYYKILHQYIGKTPIPPMFSLGYHQSRFSYLDVNDAKNVDKKFDDYNIPYDGLWLDIDHTDNKKYFTYDKKKFPKDKTKELINELDKKGRKLILVVDPHIKVDTWYPIYYKAKNNYFIKKNEKSDFIGKCWCDDASFLDFLNKDAINYWKNLILKNDDYFLGANNIHLWNDMNEPSVFKIEKNTVPKTSLNKYEKTYYEHRQVHNIYGYFVHKASYEALNQKYEYKIRPFVLTRSFYIGSHKYSALWTGDTNANFDGLKNTIPTLITSSLSGYSFVGSDIGGFAGDGNIDLYKRWYQSGVFYPLFRGHSHEFTLRREMWLFSENDFKNIRNSIIIRYNILPYIYTQFYFHYIKGMPIIRPVWFYDQNELTLTEFADSEYFFGDSILVRPVLSRQEHTSNFISVYLPENERWYNFYNYDEILYNKKFDYKINDETIGAFIKGGSIIPKKMRIKRSAKKMKNDPLTIVILVNRELKAKGYVYFDDEESFDYQKGKFTLLEINYNNKEILFNFVDNNYNDINKIEKIVIVGDKDGLLNVQQAKVNLKDGQFSNVEVRREENRRTEIVKLNSFNLQEIKMIKLI